MENKRYKHGRIYHVSFSETLSGDDKRVDEDLLFAGKDIVCTAKLDGQNTTIYSDYIHARSINGTNHPSMDWIKGFAAEWQYKLPDGYRVCGEDMYARHSIAYENLDSYFYVFSIWDQTTCLSYDDTRLMCDELYLTMVPELYRGPYDKKIIKELYTDTFNGDPLEGFVIRNTESFEYTDFSNNVAKFVSANFKIGDKHWSTEKVIPNKIKYV